VAGRAERRRFASPAEIELWRAALREVRPLSGRKAPPPAHRHEEAPLPPAAETGGGKQATGARSAAPHLPRQAGEAETVRPIPHRLDKRTAERLRRGQLAVEARLDLHGLTQDEAHRALFSFVGRAERDGLRCLLVITGKGVRRVDGHDFRGETIGILKHAVPRWLAEPAIRPRILAIALAQPKHGGSGALYVLLRRRRP
jgi:DNA-nicking Smr family endonuclease